MSDIFVVVFRFSAQSCASVLMKRLHFLLSVWLFVALDLR